MSSTPKQNEKLMDTKPNTFLTDASGNSYNASGQQIVTEAEINQARNDGVGGTISSEAEVILNSVAAGKSAGGPSTGSGSTGTGSGNNTPTTAGLDMSTQSLLENANSSKEKVDSILNEMGTQKNTGSGVASATGKYSWDQQGTEKALTQLEIDKNNAKQEALANRQTIEQNAQAYQQQADMMKYSANQSAQSAGWTGGYVLDQNRQMEYLKSSIQAQMYGAMELQKHGYDTALAAARLSYDLNQQEFAHQYYMDAVNVAVTEAQQTGYYISAEVRDMMSQYNIAQEKLKSATSHDERYEAQQVTKAVQNWFSSQGINMTEPAVKTLSLLTSELNAAQSNLQMYMNTYFEQLTRVQAADSAAASKLANDPSYFIVYDENGQEQYDTTTGKILLGNFSDMSKEEVANMLKTNSKNKSTFESYIDSTYEKVINDYLKSVEVKSGENISYAVEEENLEKLLQENENFNKYRELLEGYSYTTEAGGNPVTITIKNGKATIDVQLNETQKAAADKAKLEQQEQIKEQENNNTANAHIQAYQNGERDDISFSSIVNGYDNLSGKYGIKVKDGQIDKTNWVGGDNVDDDLDIDIGDKNYDLDVDWRGRTIAGKGLKEDDFNSAVAYLKEKYPNQSKDELIIYDGRVWFYSEKVDKWGLVQTNIGGEKLYDDLKEAAKGIEPNRWR